MDNVGNIRQILAKYKDKYLEPDVADAFYYERRPDYGDISDIESDRLTRAYGISNPIEVLNPRRQVGVNHLNSSRVVKHNDNADPFVPAPTTRVSPYTWDLSQISMPRNMIWKRRNNATIDDNGLFMFNYDKIAGDDQYIYIMGEDKVDETHPEMIYHNDIEYLRPDNRYLYPGPAEPRVMHATGVASKVLGKNLGSCQLCTLIVASLFEGVVTQDENRLLTEIDGLNVALVVSTGNEAAPFVSGLVGYYRSLPSRWSSQLQDPGSVKKMIKIFHRRIVVEGKPIIDQKMKPIIWNVEQWDPNRHCPRIKPNLADETNEGETVAPCHYNPDFLDNSQKQLDGTYCPRLPRADPGSHTVSFTSKGGVKPAPTCASGTGCGGHLCKGFFCSPMPTGVPHDRHDPKDPNASSQVPTTTRTTGPQPACDDKCKLDKGNRCSCGENGCDDKSPSCCANASCPYCDCGENGCSPSSPWCCGNDSCEWSRTGGGGGNNPRPKPKTGFVMISVSDVENPAPPYIHHYWEVWLTTNPKTIDYCKDESLVKLKTDDVSQALPPSLGPFTAEGITCKYTTDKKSVENPVKWLTVRCEWEGRQ
ncbi:hypothetical protein I7I51_00074 [Histoplasma capsulatum]|uniref:Uncharacterized protein n=1 Tax=Ajellomyces capsulatus TaxID=5037 RepID=A0A8A1M904_AJECA|nr:hypothetical protein I7I51_00074 [Histoplasma capsulatum]